MSLQSKRVLPGQFGGKSPFGQTSVSWSVRIATFLGVVLPFLGLFAAAYFLWGSGFSWLQLGLLIGMYLASGLGITVGYHRLFTHNSFETSRFVQFVFGVLGSMAVQGPLLRWVAQHRHHHQQSDQSGDPHSPHRYGQGVLSVIRGLWHSHIGWLFAPDSEKLSKYVPDLQKSATLRWVSRMFPVWVALGLLVPAAIGLIVTGSLTGALLGFIWGGLVRIFFVHHVTWSINSICHLWGRQPYETSDRSKNNLIFGVLAMGEGWHNNHHAFPTSARHGLSWWQFDLSYVVIRILAMLGLVWNVKVPAPQLVHARRK